MKAAAISSTRCKAPHAYNASCGSRHQPHLLTHHTIISAKKSCVDHPERMSTTPALGTLPSRGDAHVFTVLFMVEVTCRRSIRQPAAPCSFGKARARIECPEGAVSYCTGSAIIAPVRGTCACARSTAGSRTCCSSALCQSSKLQHTCHDHGWSLHTVTT
jgi:hypothetical protein